MSKQNPSHTVAVFQALFITFLWSTSWLLIKLGLNQIPPLTFAGLRYCLAFLCLVPIAMQPRQRIIFNQLTRRQWILLIVYGLVFYTIVQGSIFIGLAYLQAATVSLILSFTSGVVAVFGILWLAEHPTIGNWTGIGLSICGAFSFFYPLQSGAQHWIGILVVAIGMLANAGSSVIGRHINHKENLPALTVILVSMGTGGICLLILGGIIQGIPPISFLNWLIIIWLAIINTAFAFSLWNHTLRTLQAMESSIINSTMIIQTTILAWIFLREKLTGPE